MQARQPVRLQRPNPPNAPPPPLDRPLKPRHAPARREQFREQPRRPRPGPRMPATPVIVQPGRKESGRQLRAIPPGIRSEEHTSELQSHSDLVCRLLLEKKKWPVLRSCSLARPDTWLRSSSVSTSISSYPKRPSPFTIVQALPSQPRWSYISPA